MPSRSPTLTVACYTYADLIGLNRLKCSLTDNVRRLCSYESCTRDISVSAGKHATGAKRENMTVTGVNASAGNLRKRSLDRVSFAHDWLKIWRSSGEWLDLRSATYRHFQNFLPLEKRIRI